MAPIVFGGMLPTRPAAGIRRWMTDEFDASHVTPVHEQVGWEVFQLYLEAGGIWVMKDVSACVSVVRSLEAVRSSVGRKKMKKGSDGDDVIRKK